MLSYHWHSQQLLVTGYVIIGPSGTHMVDICLYTVKWGMMRKLVYFVWYSWKSILVLYCVVIYMTILILWFVYLLYYI